MNPQSSKVIIWAPILISILHPAYRIYIGLEFRVYDLGCRVQGLRI